MVRCFESRTARAEAVVQAFGVLADTENFHEVLAELGPAERAQVRAAQLAHWEAGAGGM